MRAVALAALLTLIPGLGFAQSRTAVLPPIGLPLPAIGLPLPPLGLAPPAEPTPIERHVRRGPGDGRRNGHGPGRERHGHGRSRGSVIYIVPYDPWIGVVGSPTPGTIAETPAETASEPRADAPAAADPPPASTPAPEPAPPAAAPDPAAPPIARKPFYFIEGCYLGDVPPAEAKLPASCDPAKATIYWP
jgi:hypothetical protein